MVIADVSTFGVALTWGTTYVAMQYVGHSVGVGAFLAARFGLAALVLTIPAIHHLAGLSRFEIRLGIEFGLLLFLILALETTGVKHTTAANAGFLIALSVIFVPLIERALGAVVHPIVVPATIVAVVATGMLTLDGSFALRAGDLIIIAAAVIRAAQIVAFGSRSARGPSSAVRVTIVELWVVAVCGLAFGTLQDGRALAGLTQQPVGVWLTILYLAVFASAFAFLAQLYAARVGSPSRVGLILSIEPAFAAMSAVLFSHESLRLPQIVGGSLLVAAVVAGRWAMSRAPTPASGDARGVDAAVLLPN